MIPRKHFSLQKARRFALLAGLSIGLVLLHSTSAAPQLPAPKNHRMTNDEGQLARRSDEQVANSTTAPGSSPDFVISSLEDEKKFGFKIVDKRHRYDQQSVDSQLDQVAAPSANQQGESPAPESQQIEARNEQEAVQLSEQQQQLAEQVIMDHRPSSSESPSSAADQFAGSSTQSPPTSSTVSSLLNTPASAQSSTMNPFGQQTIGPDSSSTISGQAQVQWVPAASNQQVVYARQAQPTSSNNNNNNQQQQFGNMMSGSNQVMSTVQYPTSINSIISDQQQSNGPQQQQQTGQLQTQMVNGQQQLVFVPQNGAASSLNSQLMAPNGRRMSISNWLRGLGSMLSNIFYRRDHGALNSAQLQAGNMMMQASGSAPSGSWIQLGPNAPHWLTQAQSAIQQFQQQHQQIALPGSSRLSSFLSANPQQQQAANTVTITLPQQPLNSANAFPQQQQQQIGDLQTSGSSNNYVTIQAPTGLTVMGTNQPYQQQQAGLSAQGQQTVMVGQLQPTTGNGVPGLQIQQQQQPNNIQMLSASQQQHQPTGSLVAKSNSEQIKQVASANVSGQSQALIAPSSATGTTQTRFGRSSKQQTKSQQQPQQQQQQTTTPTTQTTNGNLPLAHYSHYSASD